MIGEGRLVLLAAGERATVTASTLRSFSSQSFFFSEPYWIGTLFVGAALRAVVEMEGVAVVLTCVDVLSMTHLDFLARRYARVVVMVGPGAVG